MRHYKNLSFLFLSILFAIFLSRFEPFHKFLIGLGDYGYISAFIAGILFVSSFTISIGFVILFVLAEKLSLLEIGIIAGLGAVAGDLTIFRFVRDGLSSELVELYKRFDPKDHFKHVLHSKYFSWSLPLIGVAIIASPLPDEIGVSLLGISKMKTWRFIIISFTLNAIGIGFVLAASNFWKP